MLSCTPENDIGITDPEVKSALDSELSEVFDIMESEPNQALERLDQVIIEADAIGSKFYAGKAKWYKAYIYDGVLEDVSNAYHHYNEALKDVLQTDESSLKLGIYNNLGVLYRYYGQYDAAIRNYESALSLKDNLPLTDVSDVYYNYGVALKLKGDSASLFKAEEAFTQSLELAKKSDYNENIASVHNQIGLMYKTIGNYEIARIAYNNTIRKYIDQPNLHNYVGKAYHGIGVTYMDEGNNEAAVRAFEKALEYKKSSGSIFITKYDLGTVLSRGGKTKEAINIWKDALNEKHSKTNIEQVRIYADLTTALKSINSYEEALSYSEAYNNHVQGILEESEKYKSSNDQVLFSNVINEYEEFSQPTPFFARTPIIILTIIFSIGIIYMILFMYYRQKSKKKVTKAVSDIQSKFLRIKVD